MGWRTVSALVAFWVLFAFHPRAMAGVLAAGVLVLALLTLRDWIIVVAARLRAHRESNRALPGPRDPPAGG